MITRLIAKNFLSWKELDIEFKNGVTLIDGWNEDDQTSEGSGKSSILNAIAWGLYGKIPKDANIDDVIKEGQKTCAVRIFFDCGASVIRSRKPNELDFLTQIGTEQFQSVKGKDAKETQNFIEGFIGLSFDTFCQTVYFAQNYNKKFITSNQEEKGKILSEIQDLNVFDKARKECVQLLKKEESTLFELKHALDILQKDKELVQKDIYNEELKISHARQQRDQKIESIESQVSLCTAELYKYNSELTELKMAANEFKHDQDLEDSLRIQINEISNKQTSLVKQRTEIEKLIERKLSLESQGKRTAERYKRVSEDKQKCIDFLKNPTKNCPTCGTKLDNFDVSHVERDLVEAEQTLKSLLEELTYISSELETPIPTFDELSNDIKELTKTQAELSTKLNTVTNNKKTMLSIGAKLSEIEKYIDNRNERIRSLNLELKTIPELNTDETVIKTLQNKLAFIDGGIQSTTTLILDKNKYVSQLSNLKDGFKEIKSFVFNTVLNEVNARVQKYLVNLFEVPISVYFKNDDMKINTEVKFNGIDRSLGLLSGGQFRRVSLAVDLALSDVITSRKGAKIGVLILDEYFKDLSESSMEKCLNLLENRGQPVLLIEHNSIFKNIVNNSIMVKLQDGTSSVEI